MRQIYQNNGFLCELRGMTIVCWWHAGDVSLHGPIVSSEAAALVCRLYAIAEYTWLMFLPTDLTFSSRLLRDTEPTKKKKKKIFFFLFTSRWLCLVCCIHTCSSPPIAILSAEKQRWGSNRLAAIATRQHFGLRVMNIFWQSAPCFLTVSGKKFC